MEGDYKSRLLICSVQEKLRTELLGTPRWPSVRAGRALPCPAVA